MFNFNSTQIIGASHSGESHSDILTRYHVSDSVIGESSTCKVFLGCNKETQSPVAVKKLANRVKAQSEVTTLKEVQTFNLPHQVRFRDYFVHFNPTDGSEDHCIVLDLLSAPNISYSFLNREKLDRRLTLSEIKSIANQLLEFLLDLHNHNMIHYDIKPANLSWQWESRSLKVFDFGSSRKVNIDHSLPAVTYSYAAPEVILVKKQTCSYDIWSLGCTLFHLIQKEQLFKNAKNLSTLDIPDCYLMQIVEQIGKPSREYLKKCKRASACFDDHLELKKKWPLRKKPNWKTQITTTLTSEGVSQEEIQLWIDLLSSMLCYENRGTAQELLKSPLFKDEIKAHLVFDLKYKCKMYLQPAAKIHKSLDTVTLLDLGEMKFDIEINLKYDKNCCLHVPLDPNNQYLLYLVDNQKKMAFPIHLENEGILDITNYQAELSQMSEHFTVDVPEAACKKIKN